MNTHRPIAMLAGVPVASNWNLQQLQQLATSASDREVVLYLTYGWPISFTEGYTTTITLNNHKSAMRYKHSITTYRKKEMKYNTLVGPLVMLPFSHRVAVSPMSTRGKRQKDQRRILVDLSWPEYFSVNDGIEHDRYLGSTSQSALPYSR